jgi:formyl-CoA transferase
LSDVTGSGPLGDVLVVDLARVLSGPLATMLLGDLGARVIKVERPAVGDDTRSWGPPFAGDGDTTQSTYFLSVNRNKESVELDLTDAADRGVLERMLERADVLVENFRPGVLARLGLAHERLRERFPRLVIASITGFGHDGPEAGRSGYDQIVQGEAGLMSLTGAGPDQPVKVGVPVGDVQAGMFAALGTLAGLHQRARTGQGCVVRTSLLAALVSTHAFQGTRWLVGGELPQATGNQHPTVVPYGAFACVDGHVQLAVGNDALWARFAPLAGLNPADARFATNADRHAHRDELERLITAAFARAPVDEVLRRLDEQGIPAGRIKALDAVYASPQVRAQGLLLDVEHPTLGRVSLPGPALRFDDAAPPAHRPPPLLGEHTAALCAEFA